MPPWFRRPVSAPGVDLRPGERVLASAMARSGPVMATNHRLVFASADGYTSVGWAEIDRAAWSSDDDQLVIVQTAPVGERPRQHRVAVDEELRTRLLDVVREQVTASVVLSRHVPLRGANGIRVTGRRRPATGEIAWVVAVDAGIDIGDPGTRERVNAAIDQVRAELG